MSKPWYSVKAAVGPAATIGIYEDIGEGGLNALDFRQTLNSLEAQGVKQIQLEISSNGGDVTVGFAIIDMLNRYPGSVTVHITGIAASMASAIAMVGKEITIADGAFVMIHDCWGVATGGPEQIASFANVLGNMRENLINVYSKRTGLSSATIADMMREETWMTAKEATRLGFADRVSGMVKAAARAELPHIIGKFRNAPRCLDTIRERAFENFNRKGGRNVRRP